MSGFINILHFGYQLIKWFDFAVLPRFVLLGQLATSLLFLQEHLQSGSVFFSEISGTLSISSVFRSSFRYWFSIEFPVKIGFDGLIYICFLNEKCGKSLMDTRKRQLFIILESNLESRREKAIAAATLLFESQGLTRNARRRLKKSIVELAASSKSYSEHIKLLEFARSLTPGDAKLVSQELSIMHHLFYEWRDEFIQDDLSILSAIVALISDPYRSSRLNFFFPLLQKAEKIQNMIRRFLPQAPRGQESKVTFQLETIFGSINPGLTDDERIKKASEILSPAIIERYKKLKENKKDYGDNKTPKKP
jgi:hypothetical protein